MENERLPPQTIDSAMEIMMNKELPESVRTIARGYLDGVAMIQDKGVDEYDNVSYYALGMANAIYSLVWQFFEEAEEEVAEALLFDLLKTVKWGL